MQSFPPIPFFPTNPLSPLHPPLPSLSPAVESSLSSLLHESFVATASRQSDMNRCAALIKRFASAALHCDPAPAMTREWTGVGFEMGWEESMADDMAMEWRTSWYNRR